MRRCKNCSAPLDKIFCTYCGARNDVDLDDFKPFNARPLQSRPCPVCHDDMRTIDVGKKVPFLIERCDSCYGLFFDKNELEEMIETSVKGGKNVDIGLLTELVENPRYVDVVVYRRCPVCKKHMQRKNYGRRSGVIMDVCADHGVWLDPGELRQIMEWVGAGGMTRAHQLKRERQERLARRQRHYPDHPHRSSPSRQDSYRSYGDDRFDGPGLLDDLIDLFTK